MSITPVTADQESDVPRRQRVSPQPGPVSRVRLSRPRVRPLAAFAALAAGLVLVALLPWEWSFIDDGALLTVLHAKQNAHGAILAVPADIYQMYRTDLSWGLFRPSYWVYCGIFYLLPVGPAHAVRVAMLLAALAGPLLVVWRAFAGRVRPAMLGWTAATLLSDGSLYMGVWYPSLQELSGLCFVGLGLIARRPWLRASCWLVAAWFKAPFAWLLLGYGLLLCRRRETRAVGAAAAAFGVGTVVAAVIFAHDGRYTAAMTFARSAVELNLGNACALLGGALVAVVAGLVALRPRLDLGGDPTPAALLIGGAGYLANLLIWHTDSYYASPYVYLFSVGILLAVRDVAPVSGARLCASLATPVFVAGYFGLAAVHAGRSNTGTVVGLRDCVLRLPDGVNVGYNRQEAWIRLDYIVREHRPKWTGRMVMVEPDQTAGMSRTGRVGHLDYFINQPGYYSAAPSLTAGPVVCRTPGATVYRVIS
ncbi:MAG: hypothetical protein V7603_6116 [Micromonosporaceae bacterium]